MKYKILSLCLTLVMALSLALPAAASPASPSEPLQIEKNAQDSDALFAGYVNRVFQQNKTGKPAKYGRTAYQTLTRSEQKLYDTLKPSILKIANGTSNTSHFVIDASSYGWQESTFRAHVSQVNDALLSDLPYEFYWYDKTQFFLTEGSLDAMEIAFPVSADYSADGTEATFFLNTNKTGAASRAAANAKKVVQTYRDLSDIAKLRAYKNYICSQVAYNYDAFYDKSRPYGDPWQLIHAFDNDPSTDIVCEGYSKAFHYLCDLSTFRSNITCYLVFGNPGNEHMWNIVDIDGRSFIVDVTNCDAGSIGSYIDQNGDPVPYDAVCGDGLFLVNTSGMLKDDGSYQDTSIATGTLAYGYVVTVGLDGDMPYQYDNETMRIYGPSGVLELNDIPRPQPGYNDEPELGPHSDWAVKNLTDALELNLVPSRLSGLDLTKPMRRDEFAAVAVKLYEGIQNTWLPTPEYNPFKDTNDPDVLKAYDLGIVNGTSEDTFSPNGILNREQASTMMTRAFKAAGVPNWSPEHDKDFPLDFEMPALFRDDSSISSWAKESVYFMAANNVLNGTGAGYFSPKHAATREQGLAIAVRASQNLAVG